MAGLVGTVLVSLGILTAVDGAVMDANTLELGGLLMIVAGAAVLVLALNIE
jgi:hypothetical protein